MKTGYTEPDVRIEMLSVEDILTVSGDTVREGVSLPIIWEPER